MGVTSFDPLRIYLYEEGLTRYSTVIPTARTTNTADSGSAQSAVVRFHLAQFLLLTVCWDEATVGYLGSLAPLVGIWVESYWDI